MITRIDSHDQTPAPLQPMGWRLNAAINATSQARQQAEAQRRRADQLAIRNRQLRATTTGALAIVGTASLAMLALGVLLGFAIGSGLLRAVGP